MAFSILVTKGNGTWMGVRRGRRGEHERRTSEDTAGAGSVSGGGEVEVFLGRGGEYEYLSHLSLLFLQGSQLIALRARFVGGRGSWSPGGGLVRERTVPAAVGGRCCFVRGAEEEEEEGSLALVESSGMIE